jgi:diacylglycerol kinase family enzyme
LDIENAVAVIANGRMVDVDAAEVNGHIFINNSGLGLYPEVVRGRESEQRLGYGKWESLFRSAIRVFRRYRLMAVRLETDGETIGTKVPFVFVGNNEYELSSFQVGTRKYLDRGQLCIYTSRRTGRLALLRLAIRALIGRISQEKDFIAVCSESVAIETPRPTVTVALDGEIRPMQAPLHYRIRPRALRVIVPSNADDKTRE